MKLFFDTSALIKYYHNEDGTEKVKSLILKTENEIFISHLTKVELYSAFHRRFRISEINEIELERALKAFERSISDFYIEPITIAVLEEAKNLILINGKTKGLRTLDAIQLAVFHIIKDKEWKFICADNILCQTAKDLSIDVINPLLD